MGKKPTDWDKRAEQEKLWRDYFGDPSIEHRNALVVHYQGWVRDVVAQFLVRRPSMPVSAEDLLSAANDGLLHSIPRYDPSRSSEVKFTTFAILAVRGAIVDYLRKFDQISRSRRIKAAQRDRAVAQLAQDLGRSPSAEEVVDHLQRISVDDVTAPKIHQFMAFATDTEEDPIEERFEAPPTLDLTGEQFAGLLKTVDLRTAAIIYHYHVHGHKMKEIAVFFHLSESRVCQMYHQGLRLAREMLLAETA